MINSYLEKEVEFSLGQHVNRNAHPYYNKMYQVVGMTNVTANLTVFLPNMTAINLRCVSQSFHTGNHQICDDDVRNIWERFVSLMSKTLISHIFSGRTFFLQFSMTCRNLCERLYSKIIVGKRHYESGKRYCTRCEVYFYRDNKFCLSCVMALRLSPIDR
jgi:hypothetical protein